MIAAVPIASTLLAFCASFGCPVVARPAALIPLRHALRTGKVQLIPETMVTKVLLSTSGATGRATGVTWTKMTERGPMTGVAAADVVVLATSAIEAAGRVTDGYGRVHGLASEPGRSAGWRATAGAR